MVLNANEDHVLKTGVNRVPDQSDAVDRVRDAEAVPVRDAITIEDRHMAAVTARNAVDRLYRATGVPESIRASVIVLLVQMNRGMLNTDTGDKMCFD